MKIYISFIVIIVTLSCQNSEQSKWSLVYKNNADGEKLYGNKELLINAVRSGYPIRIGFGGRRKTDTLKSVEHFANAEFLTIVNGKEVFGQINSIFGQIPNLDADTLQIKLKHENEWTLVIGTNGERSTLSRYFDSEKTEESKLSSRGANWYVKLPNEISSERIKPIWD